MSRPSHILKTVLVAGGAGFVGARLCYRLLASGANVICVDSLSSTHASNIAKMTDQKGFVFMERDITAPLLLDQPIDEIYNLDCPASQTMYQINAVHTLKTSVLCALHLLGLAREKGARILQASTSDLDGDPEFNAQTETYHGSVLDPHSCKDESNRATEALFHSYGQQNGLTTKIARVCNTYGPGMAPNDGRVILKFIVQALQGAPLTIYGTGKQTRLFCHVDDLLDGLMLLMATPHEVSYPITLGNDDECSIAELADIILAKTRSASHLMYSSVPLDEPLQQRPDLSPARRVLDWTPKITLDEGLDGTIAWSRGLVSPRFSSGVFRAAFATQQTRIGYEIL